MNDQIALRTFKNGLREPHRAIILAARQKMLNEAVHICTYIRSFRSSFPNEFCNAQIFPKTKDFLIVLTVIIEIIIKILVINLRTIIISAFLTYIGIYRNSSCNKQRNNNNNYKNNCQSNSNHNYNNRNGSFGNNRVRNQGSLYVTQEQGNEVNLCNLQE